MKFTPEFISMAAGVLISLAFSYVPGLKDKFQALTPDYKRLAMLLALLIVSLGSLGVACLGRYDGLTCDNDGLWRVIEVFILAAIANQTAYQLTPKGE